MRSCNIFGNLFQRTWRNNYCNYKKKNMVLFPITYRKSTHDKKYQYGTFPKEKVPYSNLYFSHWYVILYTGEVLLEQPCVYYRINIYTYMFGVISFQRKCCCPPGKGRLIEQPGISLDFGQDERVEDFQIIWGKPDTFSQSNTNR